MSEPMFHFIFYASLVLLPLLAALWLLIRKERSLEKKGIALFLALLGPLFIALAMVIYVLLAPQEECGSQHAGLCFGIGLLLSFVMPWPIAILTPIAGLNVIFALYGVRNHPK